MTLDRQALADALSALPGIAGYPSEPQTISAGAAWPAWASSRRVNDSLWLARWYVYVTLPAGSKDTTAESAGPLIELVGEALSALNLGGLIAESWRLPLEESGNAIPAIRFTAEE